MPRACAILVLLEKEQTCRAPTISTVCRGQRSLSGYVQGKKSRVITFECWMIPKYYESQPVGVAELLFASEARIGGLRGGRGKTGTKPWNGWGRICAGEQVSTSCTVSQLHDGVVSIPPRSILWWMVCGGLWCRGRVGQVFSGRQVFSGTSFSGVGDGGAGVGSTPAGQESQGGMPPRGDGEARAGVEELADITRPDWSSRSALG